MQTITRLDGSKYLLSKFVEDFTFDFLPPEHRDAWSKPKIVAALDALV